MIGNMSLEEEAGFEGGERPGRKSRGKFRATACMETSSRQAEKLINKDAIRCELVLR